MASHLKAKMSEEEKDSILDLVHCVLVPNKQGLSPESLNRQFRELNGSHIPYRDMGYSDLRPMLEDAKKICRIHYGPDGSVIIKAVVRDNSAHISQMVQKQKPKKPRPQPPPRRPFHSNWQPSSGPNQFPNSSGSSYGYRHGFRPPNRQQSNFRSSSMGQRPPDQRNGPPGQGGRFGTGSGRPASGYMNGPPPLSQQRLRAPQNGPSEFVPNLSNGQPQPNRPPMSQRLGPMPSQVQTHRPPPMTSPPMSSPPPPISNTSYIKILEDYFRQKGLGEPEFKTSKIEKKTGAGGKSSSKKVVTKFYSTVKVNGQSFQTYPTEYNTEKEAEEAASKLACEKLNLGRSSVMGAAGDNNNTLPTFPAESFDILIDRLALLVGSRTNGVWSSRLEVEYSEKYGQALPADWPAKIESYQAENSVKRRLNVEHPIQDRYIIMPHIEPVSADNISPKQEMPSQPVVRPSEASSNGVTPASRRIGNQIKSPANSDGAKARSQPKPPELILPEDNLWDVYVTHVFSAMEVCVRLLGDDYSVKFEDLITDMELHYYDADKIPHVTQPLIGHIYAARVETDWHRVEVISLKGVDVTCYFIDHGGEHDVLSVDVLREIEPKFLALAPQAKRVFLAGLEPYVNSPLAMMDLSAAALARSLVGQVHTRENEISLILIDTSGNETDFNINEMILEKMSSSPEAIQSPTVTPSSTFGGKNGTPMTSSTVTPPKLSPTISSPDMDLTNLDWSTMLPLVPSTIPEEGQYFDVIVTLAGSPSNFTVQPYQESCQLERLMASMKEYYSNTSRHLSLTLEDLSKDSYFAALHTDGIWYRVKINSQLDTCTMAVKIVDYGDFSMVPLENLQPLWPRFRELPIQAINATLAGIVAVDGDWTVDDTVWFARRVVNNAFVSIIKDLGVDSSETGSLRLGLSLIDTNDPKADVIIENELVDAGRAVFFCI